MTKKLVSFFASAAMLVLSSCDGEATKEMSYNQGINIVPIPASMTQQEGNFKFDGKTQFAASSAEAKTIAEFFASKMKLSTGYDFKVVDATPSSNFVSLAVDTSIETGDEGYTLVSDSKGVTVIGKTPQGLFYGMQTLLQLLPAEIESATAVKGIAWSLPAVTIKDEPRFEWRGIMLDPCRHFIPVENIKKQLDVLAMFKINTFHWHLTEDQGWRIEIKKYPELTQKGAFRTEGEGYQYGDFYTQEQIKEVVAYASARFITVVPEIEMPGHGLAALFAYPELSCTGGPFNVRNIWGVEEDVYCAGNDSVFAFLEDIIDEVVPLFPGEYFHIGGDECPKDRWKKCPKCQKRMRENNLKDEHELQSYFVQRMERYISSKGKKMIGWDEILEGGLAPGAGVMSWRGEEGGIEAANMGHEVVMTPGNWLYLDHYQGDPKVEPVAIGGHTTVEETYSYEPIPAAIAEDKKHFIKGAQANVWSEYMYTINENSTLDENYNVTGNYLDSSKKRQYNNELMEYRIYPRIIALAELTWTPKDKKDYKDFERRLPNQLVRLDMHDINYHIPLVEQRGGSSNVVAFVDSTMMDFTTTRPIKIVYTLDGTEPTANSTEYTAPFSIKETTTVKTRTVLPSGKMSRVRTIKVEKQPYAPATEVANAKKGLAIKSTTGQFQGVEELTKATDWKEGRIDSLYQVRVDKNFGKIDNKPAYAVIAEGFVNIPEDGVYTFSSDNDQVWIDGNLLINNNGETKRFSRHDASVALAKGLHPIKVIFIATITGGWPSYWNDGNIQFRKAGEEKWSTIKPDMLFY
ncbi:MAG: family 20 glycosylhydrolase [Tannerellaceae bacterium]